MSIIDGRKIAEKIKQQVKEEIAKLDKKPVFAMFLVGSDPSSEIYIRNKKMACREVGIESKEISLDEAISEEELIGEIEKLNRDENVDAILVQLPLPKHIDENRVLGSIDPKKDVDCLHPENFSKFCQFGSAEAFVIPVTALAVEEILNEYKIELKGKKAAVIGNSNIAGKPTAVLLSEKGAQVSVCTSDTKDISVFTKEADLIVSAVGKKNLLTEEMVKDGVVVIDVGIVRDGDKIYGDVDFENVLPKAALITPVPGGVGPVTVAVLIKNVLRLVLNK